MLQRSGPGDVLVVEPPGVKQPVDLTRASADYRDYHGLTAPIRM